VEEFREAGSGVMVSEPFVDGGDVIKACDAFVDEVIAVDEDVMDGVLITAVGAICSVTG
jgi:uncharacterized protein YggL (DUF469 family)